MACSFKFIDRASELENSGDYKKAISVIFTGFGRIFLFEDNFPLANKKLKEIEVDSIPTHVLLAMSSVCGLNTKRVPNIVEFLIRCSEKFESIGRNDLKTNIDNMMENFLKILIVHLESMRIEKNVLFESYMDCIHSGYIHIHQKCYPKKFKYLVESTPIERISSHTCFALLTIFNVIATSDKKIIPIYNDFLKKCKSIRSIETDYSDSSIKDFEEMDEEVSPIVSSMEITGK